MKDFINVGVLGAGTVGGGVCQVNEKFKERIIEIDSGDNIYIVDEFAVLVYTRLYQMATMPYNADNLSKNFVLHTDRLYAISPLFDAYAIPLVDGE